MRYWATCAANNSCFLRRLQDDLKTPSAKQFLLFQGVFQSRLQNFLARRIQDVLKTSWRRLPRRLQDVFARCLLQDLFKTSLQDVFKTCLQYVFFKTFSRRVCKMSSSRLLQDVFARRFQNVYKTSSRGVCKTSSSRCLQEDVLQLRLEDVLEDKNMLHWRSMQDIFKKSSVHLHQNICFLGVYCNCLLTKLRDVMKFKINDTFLI